MGLTRRVIKFIDAYIEDPTRPQAECARIAGYSANRAKVTASELMRDPQVQNEINRRLQKNVERAERGPITVKRVEQELEEALEVCKQFKDTAWAMTARTKIIELMGKTQKMFSERVEVGLDDQLMEKLLEGRKRAGTLKPEEVKAELVRAKLPALPEPPVIDAEDLEPVEAEG